MRSIWVRHASAWLSKNMFAQYTYIDEQHKLALTSVIRQQPFVTEAYIAKLYKAARMAENGEKPLEGIAANCMRQKTKDKETWLATATDPNTGIFIQLSQTTGTGMLLAVGKKWVIQGHDPVSNTTQTKLL